MLVYWYLVLATYTTAHPYSLCEIACSRYFCGLFWPQSWTPWVGAEFSLISDNHWTPYQFCSQLSWTSRIFWRKYWVIRGFYLFSWTAASFSPEFCLRPPWWSLPLAHFDGRRRRAILGWVESSLLVCGLTLCWWIRVGCRCNWRQPCWCSSGVTFAAIRAQDSCVWILAWPGCMLCHTLFLLPPQWRSICLWIATLSGTLSGWRHSFQWCSHSAQQIGPKSSALWGLASKHWEYFWISDPLSCPGDKATLSYSTN